MLALTCILVRSAAMMNSSGADMPALTVWPRSTLRLMMMPSIGAVMTVWSRSTLALLTEASACTIDDSVDFSCA